MAKLLRYSSMAICRGEMRFALVLQGDAAETPPKRLGDEVVQGVRGGGERQSARVNVGDAIAVHVGPAGLGVEDEVCPQAVRRPQAGPLADEDQCRSCPD